jgi:hypothetical protein
VGRESLDKGPASLTIRESGSNLGHVVASAVFYSAVA